MIRDFREYFLNRRWVSEQNTKLAKRATWNAARAVSQLTRSKVISDGTEVAHPIPI
jgi:hypothetical protein